MKYYKDAESQVYAYDDTDGLPRYEGDTDYYRIPEYLVPITEAQADALRQPPPPTADQLEAAFSALVTARLDTFAQSKNYDTMDKARLAALSTEYAADGQAANAAYDATWTAAIALVPQVRSGELTPEQALEELPELVWPGD